MRNNRKMKKLNHVFLEWFNFEQAKEILKKNNFYVLEITGNSYYQLKTNATVKQLREMFSHNPVIFGYPYCKVCEAGKTFSENLIDFRYLSEWELRSGNAE